jgi:hypothetical protein
VEDQLLSRQQKTNNMAFEWNKIHKYEDNFEREIIESVDEYVFEYYGVEELEELTDNQVSEIETFASELNEYSVMQIGINNLMMRYEDVKYDRENNND